MVGARRAGVEGDEHRRQLARRDAGLGADDRERVGVALLRHQGAGAAVAVGQPHGGELLAREDLQVLAELRAVGRRGGDRRRQLDVAVGLPHRVLGVGHDPGAAEQLGQALAVERPARPGAAADPGDAQVEPARGTARSRAASRRAGYGVGQQQVADRGRLGRLEVGVVGGEVAGVAVGEVDQGARPGRAGRRAGRAPPRAPPGAARPGRPRGAGGRRSATPPPRRPTRSFRALSRELKASPSSGRQGNSAAGIASSVEQAAEQAAGVVARRARRPRPGRRRGRGRPARARAPGAGRGRSRGRSRSATSSGAGPPVEAPAGAQIVVSHEPQPSDRRGGLTSPRGRQHATGAYRSDKRCLSMAPPSPRGHERRATHPLGPVRPRSVA